MYHMLQQTLFGQNRTINDDVACLGMPNYGWNSSAIFTVTIYLAEKFLSY